MAKILHCITKQRPRCFLLVELGDMYVAHVDDKGEKHWARAITRLGEFTRLADAEAALEARKDHLHQLEQLRLDEMLEAA